MGKAFASGTWHVAEGKEMEFVDRWTELLEWTNSTQPDLTVMRLLRDEKDPSHFVSIAEWPESSPRDAWKNVPEFMDFFSACRKLCDDFYGSDYEVAVSI